MRVVALVVLLTAFTLGVGVQPSGGQGEDKPALTKEWLFRAVSFGADEKEATKRLGDLASEGWQYVGPLNGGLVAFKRLAPVGKEDEGLKADLARLQGKWEGTRPGPAGKTHRIVKVIKGNRETVALYDDKSAVVSAWTVDFRLERSGKARVFTYFNQQITAGPDKGKKQPAEVSYLYRVDEGTFAEAAGFLGGQEKRTPAVYLHTRMKE